MNSAPSYTGIVADDIVRFAHSYATVRSAGNNLPEADVIAYLVNQDALHSNGVRRAFRTLNANDQTLLLSEIPRQAASIQLADLQRTVMKQKEEMERVTGKLERIERSLAENAWISLQSSAD